MIKICVECEKEYEAIKSHSKYCCPACKSRNRSKRNKIEKNWIQKTEYKKLNTKCIIYIKVLFTWIFQKICF